jgi:ammonia channel protein AmtB
MVGGGGYPTGALDFAAGRWSTSRPGISALVLALLLGKRRLERAEDLRRTTCR